MQQTERLVDIDHSWGRMERSVAKGQASDRKKIILPYHPQIQEVTPEEMQKREARAFICMNVCDDGA